MIKLTCQGHWNEFRLEGDISVWLGFCFIQQTERSRLTFHVFMIFSNFKNVFRALDNFLAQSVFTPQFFSVKEYSINEYCSIIHMLVRNWCMKFGVHCIIINVNAYFYSIFCNSKHILHNSMHTMYSKNTPLIWSSEYCTCCFI